MLEGLITITLIFKWDSIQEVDCSPLNIITSSQKQQVGAIKRLLYYWDDA